MAHELLQIEDRLRPFQGAEGAPGHFRIGDAHHAAALGAEQRLDDDVAAQSRERFQGGVGVLAHDGRRHEQAGRFQPGAGQVLVHAGFDRGRRIEDADAAGLQPMQHVHAEDDLLQRARRHGADQDAVEAGQRPSRLRLATPAVTRRKSTAAAAWPSAAAAR